MFSEAQAVDAVGAVCDRAVADVRAAMEQTERFGQLLGELEEDETDDAYGQGVIDALAIVRAAQERYQAEWSTHRDASIVRALGELIAEIEDELGTEGA